jgi:hypothetical protein
LQFNSFDQVNKTSAQLDYWRVLYKEIPEAVLRPEKFFVFNRDSVQRGEIVNTRIAVENVTPVNMDSLRIRYKVTKPDGTQLISVLKNKPLLAGDTLIAHFQIPTASFASYGNNSLANWFVEVNPIDSLHQNEKFHYNNIGGKNFYVQDDINDPVLDVTFDGIHILNGDLVSTKPTVIATLKDENQHLVLTDTTAFRVYLIYPDTIGNLQSLKQLYFAETAGDRKVNFYPATPSQAGQKNNRARIEFRPNFTTSGTYGLSIQAKDIASNNSGGDSEDSAYKIFFNVETAATVSDVLNYPNPFSTSTQFVFKLTGEELPTYMKIQIMTITGQVVREIEMDELGPLRMGINRTTFAWDGTDQFGDRLANGVYLYRVVTNAANGQSIELKNKETSTYFKSGFGKMYLMR